jgi:anti-sigma regulatory factor (Ser/Thr protein kinase)
MTAQRIKKRLTLGTDLSALEGLEAGLAELKASCHLSERHHYQIRLALDELVTNVVSYGFTEGVGSSIVIDIAITPGETCEILYSDDAPPFNPVEHCVPDKAKKGTSENFGGLGIFLVKELMDEVAYHYANGRNLLNMRKQLAE